MDERKFRFLEQPMNRYAMSICLVFVCIVGSSVIASALKRSAVAAPAAESQAGADDPRQQILQLQQQVKHLESLVPDQAAVMTKVGYHFTNLYIAVQKENWPLADFYLGETVNNIKWAVRAKPIRKDPAGREIDLGAIAQALENTQFKDLKDALAAKDVQRCVALYDQTLAGCYACHLASGKPYLHPQKPAEPEVKIIRFEPDIPAAK
jgi:hypothetical protein